MIKPDIINIMLLVTKKSGYFLIDEVFTFDASKKELYNFIRNR